MCAPQNIASVFDFIYHDARRVGSLIAQFDPNGNPQSIRHLDQTTRTGSFKRTIGGKGTLHVAAVEGGVEEVATEQSSVMMDGTYDPFWTNALSLLDYLQEHKLLHADAHTARVGQLVLLTGSLKIINTKLVEKMMTTSAVAAQFKRNLQKLPKEEAEKQKLQLEVVKLFPHVTQAHFYAQHKDNRLVSASWLALDETSLVIPPEHLLLNHGSWIAGDWTTLAIKTAGLDMGGALPEDLQKKIGEDIEAAAREQHTTVIGMMAEALAPIARSMMGRPGGYFGLTPIMIFRQIVIA